MVTQAIEDPGYGPLLLGVQWHPEFLIFMKCHRTLVNSARVTR